MSFKTCKWNDFIIPPKGYRSTDLLILTYSLHPTILEEVLIQSGLVRRYRDNPEELADHVRCFCQVDRWQDSDALWNEHLYIQLLLAKKRIVGVERHSGSFHPKMMAILYESCQHEGEHLLRLVISSRNLTKTSNLEGALCLETKCFNSMGNEEQWQFLFKNISIDINKDVLYQKLLQADFTLCVEKLFGIGTVCEFLVLGEKSKSLYEILKTHASTAKQFIAVSPFLGSWQFIQDFIPNDDALILTNQGISEELFFVSEKYPKLLRCLYNSDEQQDADAENFLHAKIYATEGYNGEHHLFMGSANFSENGFCKNTELMVHLTSKETNFCWQIRASLPPELGQCTLQMDSDTISQGAKVPKYNLNPDELQELCKKISDLNSDKDELGTLFYHVFGEPVAGREPVDYAVDVLGNCDLNDTERLNNWCENLENYAAYDLTDTIRPYYNMLIKLFGVDERE